MSVSQRHFLLVAFVALLGITVTCDAEPCPQDASIVSPQLLELTSRGEALREFLPQASKKLQIRLSTTEGLQGQRITLFLRNTTADQLRDLLADLLSAEPDAPVTWLRTSAGSFRLEESIRRKQLSAALRDSDLQLLKTQINTEMEWLHGPAKQDLEAASSDRTQRRVVVKRAALATLLELAGEAGQAKLFGGEPLPFRIGDLPEEKRQLLREFLVSRSSNFAARAAAEQDQYWFVYILAQSPNDVSGAEFLTSLVSPEGLCESRASGFKLPNAKAPTFAIPAFRLGSPRSDDTSERVSLNLTPQPSARPGAEVGRNLNQLLETISQTCKLDVVADGYLRTRRKFPANLEVNNFPLHQLLDRICKVWDCEWRYASKRERTILVRSRCWWIEDASDVPDAQVQHFRERLGQDREPQLEDLLELAELSVAQAHKLVETGICPSAFGLVEPGWNDTADMKQALRFFNRLPPDLRRRALDPAGLPLSEVPQELLRQWLAGPLIAGAGAVTPELQREATFRLSQGVDPNTGVRVWGSSITGQRAEGTNWHRAVIPIRKPTELSPSQPDEASKPGITGTK